MLNVFCDSDTMVVHIVSVTFPYSPLYYFSPLERVLYVDLPFLTETRTKRPRPVDLSPGLPWDLRSGYVVDSVGLGC